MGRQAGSRIGMGFRGWELWKVGFGVAIAGSVMASASGCYYIGSEGGGGGAGDPQGVLSENEPTDDNGTDETGTHFRPRYHPRKDGDATTNDHGTGSSGVNGGGGTSSGNGSP